MGGERRASLRVFISHTGELRRLPAGKSFVDATEEAVKRAGHTPVDMAYFTAETVPPAQVCRAAVEDADVYVAVLGFRYGSTVPEHPDMSYTELEFETARAAGMPMLVFLLSEDTIGPRELMTDLEHGRRQEAFRRRVDDAGITRSTASTPDGLATVVLQALNTVTVHAPADAASTVRVWRAPARNQVFTGREDVLAHLHDVVQQSATVIQALHGMGGVGKTSLAIEYAHRHAQDHDVVWWVPAEDLTTVPTTLAELAHALGLATATDGTAVALGRLRNHLHEHGRWLLIYDNAEDPAALREHLCSGPGHVLITSRAPEWTGLASPVELDVLDAEESVTLLRRRAPDLSVADSRAVADALGHLPLALTQAGAYLGAGGVRASTYLELLDQRAAEVTARGVPLDYPASFAASWELAADRLAEHAPAALQLLTVCAYLAPDPVPFTLFIQRPDLLPDPLAETARDPLAFADLTAELRTRALARVGAETLQLHRLVQAVLRDRHRAVEGAPLTAVAGRVVSAAAEPWA